MPAAPSSSAELLDLLRRSGIASPDALAGVTDSIPPEPQKAAALLVAKGVVTRFQAQQLLAGRHKGFRVGPYTVLDLLGRGGMGAVYLGEHRELRRKVAIKVLVPGKDDDQKLAVERFQREARAAAALDHPNIVRLFDVSRAGETPYLVMEYVEGETLQQVLDRDGAVPFGTAAEYVAQAAAGLQHAHEKGFVHRDIKPANLIRDPSGTIKILDMGLARSANTRDKLTEQLDHGAVVGTADFIAPEQGMNHPVDGRADIYSLGATFFALLTGKPPFEGNTTQKLLQHQLKEPPSLAAIDATLPRGLGTVVAKMLAKRPADRYQTPAEVIAALAPWLGGTARVLAGLSRTNLAQGADLQAALSEASRGSGRLLAVAAAVSDSTEVDPSLAAQETAAIAVSATVRGPVRGPARVATRKKTALFAGAGLAVVAAGAVAGWLAFGRNAPQPEPGPTAEVGGLKADRQKPAPDSAPRPNPSPPIPVIPKKNPPPATEAVVFRLDLADQKPFVVRTGLKVDPNDPTRKTHRLVSRSGAEPPAGWQGRVWNKDTEMEFFAEADGPPALGIRNVSGPGSAMLFMPRFDCPSGACRLRVEYSADVRDRAFSIRFKAADARQAWDVVRPPVNGPGWVTEDLVVDLKGATGGFFEFHNTDDRPDAAVRIRSLTVTATTPPAPPPDDVTRWAEGATVYALDVAKIPAFRVQKEKGTRLSGDPEKLPPGVGCQCWKEGAVADFRRETLADVPVLSLTNLNNEKSAQFTFDLEGGMKLALEPGKAYRVKVGFAARNEAAGNATVQTTPGYKGIASARLANTNGRWAAATVSFVRPPDEDGVKLRMVVDNSTVGEGNAVCVRSLEIVELIPPEKK